MTGIMSKLEDFTDKMLHSYFNIMGEVTCMIALPSRKQFGFGFFISEKNVDAFIFFKIMILLRSWMGKIPEIPDIDS